MADTKHSDTIPRKKGPHRSRPIEGEDDGICYFFGTPRSEIKIGSTQQPGARFRHLRYSTGLLVGNWLATAEGGAATERMYHERFAEHHVRGDWFARHPDIIAEIERLSLLNGA
ncbi:MAG: GIY-YIG nuclease family protein [Sphingobium sp.]